MIKNIVVEREYSAGGSAIAQALADKLGWQLWDKQVTCEIARRLRCSVEAVERREERLDSTFYRLAKVFMRGSYEESHVGTLELLDAEHLADASERIMTDIAAKGNAVLVGRGAPWFLRGREDTYTVFIYAPFEEKVARAMKNGKTRDEAEHAVATIDTDRAAFVTKYFAKAWPLRELYDLMINSRPGIEYVTNLVLSQVEAANRHQTRSATLV